MSNHYRKGKLSKNEREKSKMMSQKRKKQQQLEWRRQRVLALLAEDYSQNEIASILQVSPASISKDVAYLKDQSKLLLRTHLKETFPLEYQQALSTLKSLRREAREMLRKPETDERVKVRLLMVIKDITESIMNLVLKGDAIDDACMTIDANLYNEIQSAGRPSIMLYPGQYFLTVEAASYEHVGVNIYFEL